MNKNLKKFGRFLKELRIKRELSLREICKLVDYDSSNWSKIERGVISPPSDKKVLMSWAKVLGFSKNSKDIEKFVDSAQVAQGIIPQDILSQKNAVDYLPAFFRTMRNTKPTKEEIDRLIELIRNA
ncbi:helix-turn-helix domain-containing protein [Patescibacteria group bacterium]|nr:helix-turn-helix domain-containing protein [Patescibacteria group bacterium]